MLSKILKLSGLHCTSCAVNIDLTIEELPGVQSSQTNYQKSEVRVDFDDSQISLPEIISAITSLGYAASEADP